MSRKDSQTKEAYELLPWHRCRAIARQAEATDVAWLMSFLRWCIDEADAARSVVALKANCPDNFRQLRVKGGWHPDARLTASPARRGRSFRECARVSS